MGKAASLKRWFLVGGCFGIVVAAAVMLLLVHDLISPKIVFALWPTAAYGFMESSNLEDQIIAALLPFGGQFLLYGLLGLVARLVRLRL